MGKTMPCLPRITGNGTFIPPITTYNNGDDWGMFDGIFLATLYGLGFRVVFREQQRDFMLKMVVLRNTMSIFYGRMIPCSWVYTMLW